MARDTPSLKRAPVAEPLLPAGCGVPEKFRQRLGDEAGRQRLMKHEGHLLLVLHAPPKPGELFRRGRLFWRSDNGLWKPQSLTHSEHAVDELLGEYEGAAAELEEVEDRADSAHEYFEALTALGPLVRSAHNLSAVVQEARSAAKEDRKLILARDRAYALTRRLELLQQDTKNTLDFLIARQAEDQAVSAQHQAKASHRLNVLAAMFFPLATIAAVFGMELGHGLEGFDAANAPLPLLAILAIGLVLGVALAAFIARR